MTLSVLLSDSLHSKDTHIASDGYGYMFYDPISADGADMYPGPYYAHIIYKLLKINIIIQ